MPSGLWPAAGHTSIEQGSVQSECRTLQQGTGLWDPECAQLISEAKLQSKAFQTDSDARQKDETQQAAPGTEPKPQSGASWKEHPPPAQH